MSKAFVRESDSDDQPELPAMVSPLPPGAKNYFTAGGFARLGEELNHLAETLRPSLATRAAEDSDARRELQALDQRIRYLRNSLATAEVVPPPVDGENIVRFGATVTVTESASGTEQYRIVGVDETDPDRNQVSWLSPIARALLNSKLGDEVVFTVPRGRKILKIVQIDYEPPTDPHQTP